MKVTPKLFLNNSPQTQEEGSLAFARNMKIDDDGNLISDYGYEDIEAMTNYNIVGHIVGLDNKIYFFTAVENNHVWENSEIIEYDEIEKTAISLPTAWTYSGGEIDGHVSTNVSGEKILTIAEYVNDINVEIPLKHINLKEVIVEDDRKTWPYANVADQSLYTQAPKCPTANLVLKDTYVKTIPNGVYVFFIRYKIRKDVYTNWFLCSRPIFGGTSEKITTLQGGLKHINLHKDAAKSFVFQLDFANIPNTIASNLSNIYPEFQLGFIITHDEATDARIWKSFNTASFETTNIGQSDNLIYFDYENVKEANIDDLLETTYELYNVHNVTAFKNKLYISNYKESDFNPALADLASHIDIEEIHSDEGNIDYKTLKLNGTELSYNKDKGYYDKIKQSEESIETLLDVDSFDYSITKLSKTNTKENNEVVKFSLIWNGDRYNPDIAVIYDIYNNLYEKQVFGEDYTVPYKFVTFYDLDLTEVIDEGFGIKYNKREDGVYYYDPSNNTHPWYDIGLTFAFGSFAWDELGQDYARQGCFYFNEDTYSTIGRQGWITRDVGFTTAAKTAMVNKIKEDIKSKSFFARAYIEITSGANIYTIGYKDHMDLDNYAGYNNELFTLDDALFSTDTISERLKELIRTWTFYNIIYTNRFKGIDENGTPIVEIVTGTDSNDNPITEIIKVNSISIKFKKFDFAIEDEDDIDSSDIQIYKTFKVKLTTTDYTSLCTFNIKNSLLEVEDNIGLTTQASTLMPLSTYMAYVHFVDEHNIITNGYFIKRFTTGSALSDKDVIRLQYTISNLQSNVERYKSCFISLVNVGDIVIECFNYNKDPNNPNSNVVHSIELDSMLYNINDNITIKEIYYDEDNDRWEEATLTNKAKYYSSGSNYPPLAFGNCGYIAWDGTAPEDNARLYVIIARNKTAENVDNLIKASGYIPLKNTNATLLPDGYYGSWLCRVKKPDFKLSSSCYVSGKDVYSVDRTVALSLSDFKNYVQVQDSVTYVVRSNFNLNYLSLTEDINDSIFTIGSASSGVKQVAKVINSATLSFIYELKSMYKDFSNKTFGRREEEYKIQFDNTIRVSNVLSDETFNNSIFKFIADNYYNVPTDRGIIVNLFSIGNNIFVHTKTSFYKFDGQQTISASDKDITLQESEPFDTGITQLFDAEYGYGGINNKEAGCITFDSYIFYDAMSNHIFAYGGNSQIQLIDATIYKLLCHYKPTECRTLHDDANHRVLFEFVISSNKSFTISYNYKSKSFVSIHDITLENAFHSRYISYSYKQALCSLFNTDAGIDTQALFGNATLNSFLDFGAETQEGRTSPFNIAVVLFPQQNFREVVDSVNYVGNILQSSYDENDIIKIPQITADNPVAKMYIITDVCVSTPIVSTIDDTVRPNPLTDYKGFKYDKGFWNANYFRNNINKENIYNYPDQPRADQNPNSDNNSLVYGKYFIIVFDFINDTPIKFEQVNINNNNY